VPPTSAAPASRPDTLLAPGIGQRIIVGPDYRLGPGDRLVVQWSGRVTRSEYVDVGPEGGVFLPEAGSLNVAGQTLVAARAAILERLRRVIRDVRVEIQLARPRAFRVYLSGAVIEPGPVEAVGGSRAGDVLIPSRLRSGASRRNVRVMHRDGSQETADLERLFRLGDHTRDPWLRDGDAVVVPWIAGDVQVSGAVPEPGLVEFAEGDSAGALLRLAGGPRPDAAPEGVTWIHWGMAATPETLHVTLRGLLDGSQDGPIAQGDHLLVRFVPNFRETGEVQILGEVARPGGYPVRASGTRLTEVVAAAGGLLPTANTTAILLRRPRTAPAPPAPEAENRLKATERELSVSEFEAQQAELASRREEIRVDWTSLSRSPALDPLLSDGDVVTVEPLVASIRIDGQVLRPGLVRYEPGRSVRDYVRQAGGLSARGWNGHEQVTRSGTGHTLLGRNVRALSPGDFIWVPMRPVDSIWRKSGDLLSGLAQIATIVIAIRSVR